jgi:hypothetical protein
LILEVPARVILADGTSAAVKSVAARVVDGRLESVTYTVEKCNGGWAEVAAVTTDGPDVARTPHVPRENTPDDPSPSRSP